MIQCGFYSELDRDRITETVRKEGFDPICITDPSGHVYPAHRHAETKLLVFLKGKMAVVEHSAWVGPEGCVFLWAERVMN